MAEEPVYLKRAEIKGDYPIRDVAIDFQPGLNIIIGYNGVGKTQFVEQLFSSLNFKARELTSFMLDFNQFKIKYESNITTADNKYKRSSRLKLTNNGTEIELTEPEDIINIYPTCTYIGFGIPQNVIDFLSNTNTIEIGSKIPFHAYPETIYFSNKYQKIWQGQERMSEEYVVKKLLSNNELFNRVVSQITDISRMEVSVDPTKENYPRGFRLENQNFYFSINGKNTRFSELSDGNKRLVYLLLQTLDKPLVKEISLPSHNNTLLKLETTSHKNILFIEEPELGIHPHQLHRLMQYIKGLTPERQVILTTHSPQVLDVLGPDELDAIIIADFDKEKDSTTLRNLTDEEKTKAKKYREKEGLFLSDYWMHSNLQTFNP